MEQLICEVCGKTFERERRRGTKPKKCPSCKAREKPTTIFVCQECGVVIRQDGESGPKPTYCKTCKNRRKYRNWRAKELAERGLPFGVYLIECQRCGNRFEARSPRAMYCTDCKYPAQLDRVREYNKQRQPKPLVGHTCERCGNEFLGKHNAKYCVDCRPLIAAERMRDVRRYRAEHQISLVVAVPETKTCWRCGQTKAASEFCGAKDRADGLQSHCKACQAEINRNHRHLHRKPRVMGTYHCPLCGADIVGWRDRRCDACDKQIAREKSRIWSASKWQPVKHKCKECGKVFVPEYGSKRRSFCSQQCMKKYGHKHHYVRGTANQRAKAIFKRLYGCVPRLMYEHIKKDSVFERDGWVCHICGKPIDKRERFPSVWCASIDHVVPLAKGGAHLYSNVRAAHLMCNSLKGDHLGVYGNA